MATRWWRLSVLAAVGLALLLPLLGDRPWRWLPGRQDARHVAEEFLDAVHKGDHRAAGQLLVADARKTNPLAVAFVHPSVRIPFTRCEVGAVAVRGSEAKVFFTVTFNPEDSSPIPQVREKLREQARQEEGKEGFVLLDWEEGHWRVRGVTVPARPGEQAAFRDFTDPATVPDFRREAEQLAVLQVAQNSPAFDALQTLDAAAFEAAWKADCVAQDVPARDVLRQRLGLNLIESAGSQGPLGNNVSVNFKGWPRLKAAEEVFRRVGLRPRFVAGSVMADSGPRPFPVTFAGPFLVEVEKIEEYPAFARGVLTLRCFVSGIPPVEAVRLEGLRATGPDSRNLLRDGQAELPLIAAPNPSPRGPVVTEYVLNRPPAPTFLVLPLRNLLADLSTIPQLSGRVRVTLPTVVEIRLEKPRPGMIREVGKMRWTVSQAAPGSVTLDGTGVAGRRLLWMAYDSSGRAARFGETPLARDGPLTLTVPKEIGSLTLKVVGAGANVDYEFAFREIPLKSRPPQQLEPARFPGHDAPASVRIVQRDVATRVKLEIENHCQKDIESVRLKLAYLDREGKVLREIERAAPAATPGIIPDGRPRSLVIARGRALVELVETAAPPGAVRIEARLTGVEYTDAQTWAP
jgi:hypothetical protein